MVMDILTRIFQAILTMYLEMAPWLLFGFAVAGLLYVLLPRSLIEAQLGGRGLTPVLKASLFGVPLPLCSCSVIPVAASLRRQGAGRGATLSFLLSTPQTGVDSIFVTWSLLGPMFALLRPVTAFASGVLGGMLLEKLPDSGPPPESPDPGIQEEREAAWRRGLRYGFVTLPRDIAFPLLVGLVAAGLLGWALPPQSLPGLSGGGIVPMLILMLAGIPLYVCATGSVPVAAALLAAGVSPGAVLVFLMTGPASNAASVTTITRILGRRAFVLYLATLAGSALVAGLTLDRILVPALPKLAPKAHLHGGTFSLAEITAALLLLLVLLPALRPARSRGDDAGGSCAGPACCLVPADRDPSPAPLPDADKKTDHCCHECR